MKNLIFCSLLVCATVCTAENAKDNQLNQQIDQFINAKSPKKRAEIVENISAAQYDAKAVLEQYQKKTALLKKTPPKDVVIVRFENKEIKDYLISFPKGYSPKRKWPVIIAFHGAMSNAQNCLGRWKEHSDGFILVCPNGRGRMGWTLGAIHIPLITDFIDDMQLRVNADPDKIYLTGHSMGGHVCWNLATLHPDQFAAVAPTASRPIYLKYMLNLLSVPIMVVQGEDDPIVPLDQNKLAAEYVNKNGGAFELVVLPETGHGFQDGQQKNIVTFFKKHVRKRAPEKITYTTTSPPFDKHYWISLNRISRQNKFSIVKATIHRNEVKIICNEVQELTVNFSKDMIDFAKTVKININNKECFSGIIKPDVRTFLNNQQFCRGGFGFVASVKLEVKPTGSETK